MSVAKKFQCHICEKGYDKQFNFSYHVAHHFDERPFACDFPGCSNSYKTKADLRQHGKKSHEKSLGLSFTCPECNLSFDSSSKLNVHKRQQHSSKPGWCEICNRNFSSLKSHQNIVHRKIRPFTCDLDGKKFAKLHGLSRHIDCVHLGLSPYQCLQCNKTFKESGSLKNHIKRHSLQKLLKPKKTENIEDWSDDEEIVVTKIIFKCQSCSKNFDSQKSLIKHEQRVHSDAQFICDLCPQKCISKRTISKHITNFHVMKVEAGISIESKIFKCGTCKKIFNSKIHLMRHKSSIHLEIQEYLCEHCSASFCEQRDLNKHLKKIHNQEVTSKEFFSCDFCKKTFRSKYNFEKHEASCKPNSQEKLSKILEIEAFLWPESIENPKIENLLSEDENGDFSEGESSNQSFQEFDVFDSQSQSEFKEEQEIEIKDDMKELEIDTNEAEMIEIKEEPYSGVFVKIEEPEKFSCTICNEGLFMGEDVISLHFQLEHVEPAVLSTRTTKNSHKLKCQVCQQVFDSETETLNHFVTLHRNPPGTSIINKSHLLDEIKEARLKQRRKYMRNYREQQQERETQEESARRRAVHAEKKRLRDKKRRDMETEEEAMRRRALDTERKRIRRLKLLERETPEETAMRRAKHNQRTRDLRKIQREKETIEETAKRKSSHAQQTRDSRKMKKINETEDETAARLANRPVLYCDQCGLSFIDRRTLRSHAVRYHTGNSGEKIVFRRRKTTKVINCEDCNEEVFGKNELLAHRLHKHFNFKIVDKHKFLCLTCEQVLNCRRTALRHHRQVHHGGSVLFRTCQECNSQFKLYEDFKRHAEEDHKNVQICLICGIGTRSSVEFLAHKKTHRTVAESEKHLSCDICGFKAQQKATIDLHMAKIHDVKMKEYSATCEICGEFFSCYQNFQAHRVKHRPRTVYTYNCNLCDKKCYNMRDLKDHEISHTNPEAKPYRCAFPGCIREYFVFRSYQCHIESHQENRNQCKACQMIFTSREKLASHTDEFHPEIRRFSCSLCGKTFTTNSACLKHRKSCFSKSVE